MVGAAVGAEAVDVFLHEPSTDTLVIAGASHTPLGRRESEIGMDRLPITNGGRTVEVYESGDPYVTGCAERDPMVPGGFTDGLGVRSLAAVPLDVASRRRGVLQALSTEPDAFTQSELDFLMGVARWVGLLVHRAELVDLLTREAVREARRTGVDELVTALAHDLGDHRSPLRTCVDSLERRARQENRQSDVEDVAIAAVELGRLRGLLADLLWLGRLGQETSALRQQHVDLAALAEKVVLQLDLAQGKVRVQAPEETVVEADPDRLRQAIRDLLTAAISVSPDGIPVVVEVSTRTGHDQQWADLFVRDETPSAVASERVTPVSNAGGLGLYVARAVAESHGGTLAIESSPRQGTTYWLRLPMGKSE
jgi:signal transduction histidine kinase